MMSRQGRGGAASSRIDTNNAMSAGSESVFSGFEIIAKENAIGFEHSFAGSALKRSKDF